MTNLDTVTESQRYLILDLLDRAKRGESIRQAFADHARIYIPGNPADSIAENPDLVERLTHLIKSVNVYTDQLNFIHGRESLFIEGMGDGTGLRNGVPDHSYRVVRWCISADIYSGLIQRLYWHGDAGHMKDESNIVIAAKNPGEAQ